MTENDSQPDDEVIGANLRRLRMERQLSQAALANRAAEAGLSFHQQTIDKVENGRRPLRLSEAAVLVNVLGADLGELLASRSTTMLIEQLRSALDQVQDSRTSAIHATSRYLAARREARPVLEAAIAAGYGPMDQERLADASPAFRDAWTSGTVPERFVTDLTTALAWDVQQLPRVAERLHEMKADAESARQMGHRSWASEKMREVAADTPPGGD